MFDVHRTLFIMTARPCKNELGQIGFRMALIGQTYQKKFTILKIPSANPGGIAELGQCQSCTSVAIQIVLPNVVNHLQSVLPLFQNRL